MDRSRQGAKTGGCGHAVPIVVERAEGGGRAARCLACGHSGPVVDAADAGAALRELRATRRWAPKMNLAW